MSQIRLIYRSENAMNVAGTRLLIHFHDIVATARRNNAKLGVFGFLMFDRARFHQILEGDAKRVDDLFAVIANDPRHAHVECLSRTPISAYAFSDWSMGAFLSDNAPHPLQAKHRMKARQPVEADAFLRFAKDFTALEAVSDQETVTLESSARLTK
ncbi:MAG: BLUF domain-containing protein [Beijerinckiaceae bacterium]